MKKKILMWVIAIFVIVLGVYFFLSKPENKSVLYQGKSAYKIEDFKNSNLDQEEANRIIGLLNQSYIYLAEKNNPYLRWVDIGLYKKVLGDIDGAENAWRNAISLIDNPVVAYGNLANLYFYYKKDFALAEEYYLKAMENSSNSYTYREGLSDLYYYELKEKSGEIESIMNTGADKEPESKIYYYSYLISIFGMDNNQLKVNEYTDKIKAIDPNWQSDIQDIQVE